MIDKFVVIESWHGNLHFVVLMTYERRDWCLTYGIISPLEGEIPLFTILFKEEKQARDVYKGYKSVIRLEDKYITPA